MNLEKRDKDIVISVLNGATYSEAGAVFGISEKRVRQIIAKFIRINFLYSELRTEMSPPGMYQWTIQLVRLCRNQIFDDMGWAK